MVGALDSGSSGPSKVVRREDLGTRLRPGSGRGYCVVFLRKTLHSHSASIFCVV